MTDPIHNNRQTIFIADDDEDDVAFVISAFNELQTGVTIRHFPHGRALMTELLNGEMPDMIILDLNMPVLDGRETLRQIRSTPSLAPVPVAILSTCNLAVEKDHCFRLGADAYYAKPYSYSSYLTIASEMMDRFLERVRH